MSVKTIRLEKQGFTLVELSIVLVIIGLLIGGILVARSMIGTAKLVATASQIQQFDAGVMNFKTKFNYLPGDAPAFGGDGDGVLDNTAASGFPDDANIVFTCEIANFWNNVEPSKFPGATACNGLGSQANISGSNKNVPEAKLGSPGSFFIADSFVVSGSVFADKTNPRNFYVLLDATKLQAPWSGRYHIFNTISYPAAVKAADLLALDKKMDDGIANTGNVLSGLIEPNASDCSSNCGGPSITTPRPACSSGPTYVLTSTDYECTPLIRIGGQAGVLQ